MTSVPSEPPVSHVVPSEDRRYASAVHEPSPAGPPLPRLIDRARQPRCPPHATRALARVFHPAGTAASQAGAEGHEALLAQYGDRLICVRYRYDAQRKKRLKTVELLVAECDWEPPRPHFAHDQIVGLRVAFTEVAVRDRVKQAGGTWNREQRVWQLRYDRVVTLGLNNRIVDEPASSSGCPVSRGEHLPADARRASR